MGKLNPVLPSVGGDEDVWGTEVNAILTASTLESNDQDGRIGLLEIASSSLQIRTTAVEGVVRDHTLTKPDGGLAGQVLTLNADGVTYSWRAASSGGGTGVPDDGNDYVAAFQAALQGGDYTSPVDVTDGGDGTFNVSTTVTDNGDGTFTTVASTSDLQDGTFTFI